jgi:hypothetical protein
LGNPAGGAVNGRDFFSVRYEIFEKSGPSLSKMWEELNRPRSFLFSPGKKMFGMMGIKMVCPSSFFENSVVVGKCFLCVMFLFKSK